MTSASTTSSEPLPDPRRVWVRAPNWVGDALMATPALRALRRARPRAEIVLCGRPWVGELLRGIGSFDRFVPDAGSGWRGLASQLRPLRRARFDWAILLPDSPRNALAPWLARVPVRVGYARDGLRRALLSHPLAPPSDPDGRRRAISMIERYLRLVRPLGCPDAGLELDLAVDEEARDALSRRLERAGVADAEPLLAVCPGASFGSSKLWPAERFARACELLAERGLRPVLAPGPGEEGIAGDVAARSGAGCVVLTDPTIRLPELAALIERARLLLCNDTGPRQVAVALDTPAVVLMGPTDPAHTAHWLERQRVLREDVDCSPCHLKTCPIDHRCMTRIRPERVAAAARELLA
ncbi:MAG: lipopolysaccharide heptosyltransferase II [Proteobacteria bacterium]|nr:lipopolysaccharide heptosyltransferase II [Pseudomonadota bacterium]